MSILGTGRMVQEGALAGLRRSAALETEREGANRQIRAAETGQKVSSTSSGLGLGAGIGAMTAMSGAGTAGISGATFAGLTGGLALGAATMGIGLVGAGIGYLLSEIF